LAAFLLQKPEKQIYFTSKSIALRFARYVSALVDKYDDDEFCLENIYGRIQSFRVISDN
jgi:hypothetical protein